jgi:hypothetical protein
LFQRFFDGIAQKQGVEFALEKLEGKAKRLTVEREKKKGAMRIVAEELKAGGTRLVDNKQGTLEDLQAVLREHFGTEVTLAAGQPGRATRGTAASPAAKPKPVQAAKAAEKAPAAAPAAAPAPSAAGSSTDVILEAQEVRTDTLTQIEQTIAWLDQNQKAKRADFFRERRIELEKGRVIDVDDDEQFGRIVAQAKSDALEKYPTRPEVAQLRAAKEAILEANAAAEELIRKITAEAEPPLAKKARK